MIAEIRTAKDDGLLEVVKLCEFDKVDEIMTAVAELRKESEEYWEVMPDVTLTITCGCGSVVTEHVELSGYDINLALDDASKCACEMPDEYEPE